MGLRDWLLRHGSAGAGAGSASSSTRRRSLDGHKPSVPGELQDRAVAGARRLSISARPQRSSERPPPAAAPGEVAPPPRHDGARPEGGGAARAAAGFPPAPTATATAFAVSNPSPLPSSSARSMSNGVIRYELESVLPPFHRARPPTAPREPDLQVPHGAGAVLSDGFVVFTVPDGWDAVRTDRGFRLTCGPCVGFVRAMPTEQASASLCDTSQLAVLDAFDVLSSPVVDANPDLVVLVVEYRHHGAGRGLAIVEPGGRAGAVVMGTSGPEQRANFLRETEQQLLSSACVVKCPPPQTIDSIFCDSPPPSAAVATAANGWTSCSVM
jgi:hypothetical protein